MVRFLSLILCILCLVGTTLAQEYPFESKKAQKFYLQLEDYYAEGDYERMLEKESDIESYFLNKKDTLGALMHEFLGEAYLYWDGDLVKSLEYYQKAYDIRKSLDIEGNDVKNLIFNLAYIQDELGKYMETEALYLKLLKLEEKEFGVKSEEYYVSATSLLDHYVFTEEYNKGLDLAKELKKSTKNRSYEEAIVLKFLGDFYQISGSKSKSEKALLESIEILKENGMYASIEFVNVLNSLAGLYSRDGKIPLAEEISREAISIIDRFPGEFDDYRLNLQSNLATILARLGNYDESINTFKENIEVYASEYGESSFIYGMEALNLANTYSLSDRYEESVKYLQVAKEVFLQDGGNNLYYARVMQQLTKAYTKLGELDKAEVTGKEAIALMERLTENLFNHAYPYFFLGDTYFLKGDMANAKKYHLKALELRKKSVGKTHPAYAKSTNKLAILSWYQKDMDEALGYYQETFDNYFRQINLIFPILSEEEKSKFYFNNLKPTFEQYNSFIVETSLKNKDLIGEMYNYQLATKGLILYATNKVRDAILNSGDSAVIDKYTLWIEQKEKLAKLFSASEVPLEIRNQKIDSLSELADELERDLSRSSSTFAESFANRDLTWKDVRDKLKPGEAAVEIIRFRDFNPDSAGVFTDEVYYAALVVTSETQDNPELVLMRNGKLMENKYLSNYRNAIKYKVNEDFSYRLFWKPIANKLAGINKVYFSPDGVFNQISIYTLRNPETGNFSIDEIEIQVVTNTKDMVAYNDQLNSNTNRSYLFGYPNYNMGAIDQRVKEGGGTSAKAISDAASEGRSVRGARGVRGAEPDADFEAMSRAGAIPRGLRGNMLRYMRSNQMLGLLPGTKKEVNLIDSLYQNKSANATMYLSNDALEDSIKVLKSPRTLHIATHGFFLESEGSDDDGGDGYVQNPLLRSGLILAGANSYISEGQISNEVSYREDGILTAYEAMNLNLENTELVVLSACETGLGEVKNGEGVYGLQRAFQVAGADAIIMSMWTVDDAATQELMTIFYEEWLSGKTKQSAFITAQKRLKDKWKAPYYWGAFVMIGN